MKRMIFTLLVILGFCANASGPIWASEANSGLSVGYQTLESEKFNGPLLYVATVSFTKPLFNGVVRMPAGNLKPTQRFAANGSLDLDCRSNQSRKCKVCLNRCIYNLQVRMRSCSGMKGKGMIAGRRGQPPKEVSWCEIFQIEWHQCIKACNDRYGKWR